MEENKKIEQENIEETKPTETPNEPLNIKLEEDDGSSTKFSVPWKGLIFIGVIITLMIVCIVVIAVNGGLNA